MANPNKLVYFSLIIIIIILLSLVNLFQIIHAIDNNNNNNATTQNHKGFSLRLIHRDRPNLTEIDATTRKQYIQLSKLRLKSLARIGKNNKTNIQDQIIRPPIIRLDTSIYAVELGMGTFDPFPSHKTVYLGFDTGSDLTWTQCEGCGNNCFRQIDPLYPASKSFTYKEVPCSDCPSDAKCVDNTCRLVTKYGNGAKVDAILAHESFTFETPDTPQILDDILFGCGINMQGFHEDNDPDNRISGIFGMSYGERSFQEQKSNVVKGKFQYCLQKKEYQVLPAMFLRFGDDCIQPGTPSSIPMFQHQNRPYYYLDLRGIRVGQKDLEIPPDVFQILPNGKGGTFIDTGTAISLLTTSAYQVLEAEVAAYIDSRNSNVERLDGPSASYEGFGLCYKRVREPTTFHLPWVTWVFANNVIFVMNPDVVFEIYTKHDGQVLVCLNFFGNSMEEGDGMTVLGSMHQVGHRITYDIPNGQLLVANENCNKGR